MARPEQEFQAVVADNERLRKLLKGAREKLIIYRRERGGEYTGGPEYSHLMNQIDAALGITTKG